MSRLKETDKGNEDRRIRQTNNSYDDPERPDLLTLTCVFSKTGACLEVLRAHFAQTLRGDSYEQGSGSGSGRSAPKSIASATLAARNRNP